MLTRSYPNAPLGKTAVAVPSLADMLDDPVAGAYWLCQLAGSVDAARVAARALTAHVQRKLAEQTPGRALQPVLPPASGPADRENTVNTASMT